MHHTSGMPAVAAPMYAVRPRKPCEIPTARLGTSSMPHKAVKACMTYMPKPVAKSTMEYVTWPVSGGVEHNATNAGRRKHAIDNKHVCTLTPTIGHNGRDRVRKSLSTPPAILPNKPPTSKLESKAAAVPVLRCPPLRAKNANQDRMAARMPYMKKLATANLSTPGWSRTPCQKSVQAVPCSCSAGGSKLSPRLSEAVPALIMPPE
mmetsp:Transcript_17789/g.41265  ORF Transcript_17789/g.41265 Transcript_17789/m.41265 type:complete len:206 (-) Transcript_17789:930-1547(-)